MDFLITPVIILGAIGLIAAVVLFACSKKFAVKEDPRLPLINEALPQANCGGCGFPGCSGFASACIKAAESGSLDGFNCSVGGPKAMGQIADILGLSVAASTPKVAVVRCNGSCANRPKIAKYDGLQTCRTVNSCGAGETACGFGCLGCGDCVAACKFDAIHINPETGLPEVDENKCVACGACVKACPRNIIELRPQGIKGRRVWVSCVNKEKGPAVLKACKVSCIACGACVKACKFDAITVENNVAYIDAEKCKLCRACEAVCPRDAIRDINFPKPVEKKKPGAEKPATLAKPAAENAPKETINTNLTSVDAKTETPKNDAVAEKPIELKKEA